MKPSQRSAHQVEDKDNIILPVGGQVLPIPKLVREATPALVEKLQSRRVRYGTSVYGSVINDFKALCKERRLDQGLVVGELMQAFVSELKAGK